ncbi:MAG: hypothetical protein LBT09_04775 [Planctomycetaceae bacterium]|nr:hypothetical protein [Planctomycetaceae bacterium]
MSQCVIFQYVILLHRLETESGAGLDSDNEHWDVMLEVEVDGQRQLDTWAIPPQINLLNNSDSKNSNCKLNFFSCPAKKLPYHRIDYLNYEGIISNNRGNVKRIDNGTYQKINEHKFKLSGKLFNGELTIINSKNESGNSCEIIFTPAITRNNNV